MDKGNWIVWMALLVAPAVASAVEPNPEWSACSSDVDCVQAPAHCTSTAVNRIHREAYVEWMYHATAQIGPTKDCIERVEREEVARCKEGRCVLEQHAAELKKD